VVHVLKSVLMSQELSGKSVLITGAARRVGRALALGVAKQGATVIIHHGHSLEDAASLQTEITAVGGQAHILQADLGDLDAVERVVPRALAWGPLYALVNNAAIFEPLSWANSDRAGWERHLAINLTAPFLLSQAFAKSLPPGMAGRIINILDWRALRPGPDHLPYTISKVGLTGLTQSLAQALAPQSITVNGIALGAILPPASAAANPRLLEAIPAGRWADLDEVVETLLFLLSGPAYITGEIIHVDGGRHLV
jgi:NAD(P)-dependent dehydrogenase (short-subunit alcohol dehydrogenase family)